MDPIIQQNLDQDKKIQASNNLIGASALTPSAGQTALGAGPKVGVPPDVAVYNPAPVQQQATLQDAQAKVSASPQLTSFIAQAGPATVAAAQPHLEGLAELGQKVQDFLSNTDSSIEKLFGKDAANVYRAPAQALDTAVALDKQGQGQFAQQQYLQGALSEVKGVGSALAAVAGLTPVGAAYNVLARPASEGLATATEAGVSALGGKTTPAQHAKDAADFEKSIGLGILAIKPAGGEVPPASATPGTDLQLPAPEPSPGAPPPAPNVENPQTPEDFAAKDAATEAEANRVYRSLPVRDGDDFAVNYQGYVTHGGGQPVVFANADVAQAWVDKVGNPNPTSTQQFVVLSDGDGPATVIQTNLPERQVGRPAGEDPVSDAVQATAAKFDMTQMEELQNTLAKFPRVMESPELLSNFIDHIGTKTIDIPGPDLMEIMHQNPDLNSHAADVISFGEQLEMANAAADGTVWQAKLSDYLKLTAGQPWAQAFNQLAVLRPGGISVQQTQEQNPTGEVTFFPENLGDWEPEESMSLGDWSPAGTEALKAAAPVMKQAVVDALNGAHLTTVFDAPNALGMNKPQFLAYSNAIKDAQQKTYEKTVAAVAKQIKKYGDQNFKDSYNKHFEATFDEVMNNQPVAAMFTMLYAEGEPTAYLPGPDGQPLTLYRATHHPNVEPRQWFIPASSPYKGISFAANPKFADRWGSGNYTFYNNPQDKQTLGYDAEGNRTSGDPHHKGGIVHIVHIKAKSWADYRRPEDVAKAAEWYKKNYPYMADKTHELLEGSWSAWERPDMMDALGWDVVRMREASQQGEPNAYTHKMDNIHFKWVDAKTGEIVKLAPEVQKLFKQYKLPNALFAPGGMDADEAAFKFGYENAAQMLEEIAQLAQVFGRKDPKKFVVQAAKEQAQSLAEQEVGITLSKEDIQQIAREQTAAPHAQDILLDELNLLYSMAPPANPFTKQDIYNFADVTFDRMKVKVAINTRSLANQVNRYANKAERAVIKGKFLEAISAKQEQIIKLRQTDASFKFAKLEARINRIWKGWAAHRTMDKVEQKFLNYVHLILMETGQAVNRDRDELLANIGGITLPDFIQQANASGLVSIKNAQVPPGQPQTWTVAQWQEVRKLLASLMKSGRTIQEVKTKTEEYNLKQFGALVLGNANRQNPAFTAKRLRRIALAQFNIAEKMGHEVASTARSYLMAQQATLSTVTQIMDYSKNGPMFNAWEVPLEAAGYKYADYQEKNVGYLRDLRKLVPKKYMETLRQDITTPEDMWVGGQPFLQQRAEMVGIMLNMGTSDNFTKLCEGYDWDPALVMDWIERTASADDKKYVQGVWDILDKYWPDIAAQGMAIQGVAPTKVPAQSFIKELRGGYYPLWMANPSHMPTDPVFGQGFSPALPSHSWIEERKKATYQVSLNPNNFVHRIDQIAYDLAFRETLMQVMKTHALPEVQQAINTLMGPEMGSQVTQAIEYIAKRNTASSTANDTLVNAINRIKSVTVLKAVLFNIRLVFLHAPVAAMHSVGVGGPQFFSAMKDILQEGLPVENNKWIQLVHQHSPDIRLGWDSYDRDIHTAFEELQGRNTDLQRLYLKLGTFMLTVTSQLSSYPLWLAVFRKSLLENALDEKRAINLANKAVRDTHGSATSVDLAAYLRANNTVVGAVAQTFLTFRSFASSIRQRGILANRALMRVAGNGYGKGPPAPPMPPPPNGIDGSDAPNFGDQQQPMSAAKDFQYWLQAFLFFGISSTVFYAEREALFHPDQPWWEDAGLGLIEGFITPYAGGNVALELAHNLEYVQIHDLKKEWEKHWLDLAATTAMDGLAIAGIKAPIPQAVINPVQFNMNHQKPSAQRALARHPGDAVRGFISGSTGRKP